MDRDEFGEKFRHLFQEMRREDAGRTPAFSRVAYVSQERRPFAFLWGRFAAAATLIMVLGAWLVIAGTPRSQSGPDLQTWATLSNWEAPTDTLLTQTSTPWSSELSLPTDSLIQRDSAAAEPEETI